MKNPNLTLNLFLAVIMSLSFSCRSKPEKDLPIVETAAAVNVAETSATVGGSVTGTGNATVSEFGIFWSSTNNSPDSNDNKIAGTGSPDNFSITISGLNSGSEYYYKAYAVNAEGTGTGSARNFRTLPGTNPPPPATWTGAMSINSKLFGSNIIATDEENFWMMATPIIDLNPVPLLPVHIYKSNDGGLTWSDNTIPYSDGKYGIQLAALDATTAWVVVKGKGLYQTTDEGSTWSLLNQTDYFKNQIAYLHFFDMNEGVARFSPDLPGIANDSIIIMKTSNGGTSWSKIDYHNDISMIPGESGWFTGKGGMVAIGDTVAFPTDCGRIFMSYDRGNTWKAISYTSSSYEIFNSIAFISSRKFALVSLGKSLFTGGVYSTSLYPRVKVFATEDGGNTWQIPMQVDLFPANITSFPGQNDYYLVTGFFANSPGGTYFSRDGGRNFIQVDSLNNNIVTAGFASINKGVGVSLNLNQDNFANNKIFTWSPERLYRKNIIPR